MAKPKEEKLNEEELKNELFSLMETEEQQGERYYARKFKILYNSVRKALVKINKQRGKEGISNEVAYKNAIAFIEKLLENN